MNEKLARIFVIVLLLGGSIAIGISWWSDQVDVITLHARMPEEGGWTPADLTIEAGQPLHLHLTSDDVIHSFAIGQSDQPAVDIKPGEMTKLTLTFDQPGTYTFYCTRWCGANHWRMRGTIIVTGEEVEQADESPLYLELGLDIDAVHEAQVVPDEKPSVQRGKETFAQFPILNAQTYQSLDYYRSHSPEQVWQEMRGDEMLTSHTDQQLWDAVAFIWQSNTTPEALLEAEELYAENCAACHGVSGAGDGVFSGEQVPVTGESHDSQTGHEIVHATDFTDPYHILSTSPAASQGKLIRGGMGTGMPMWGVISTEEQTWSLVSYLYSFQFEEAQ
ncbi:MAG: c-type cytochrome [Anaerolineae bacterium]|jgi:mono/diheme cytochrome c family protein/plastocyanin|nr:c-type cytochrome [Anaerolineae bacterium]MBT4309608.1 c-type cytochrome [Anaerolineae bacterium]MBT4456971.1 c-type cytochrome [Anaerolineae bacterium]MBT4843243.1 c-type cytochrome [Anaerolineae bacterium]MBT6060670.1 c-type cytochrome [Anaerolineae bacterium]